MTSKFIPYEERFGRQDAGASADADRAGHEPSPASGLGHSVTIPSADQEHYTFTNGWTMRREDLRPHFWLLLDPASRLIDRDHDIIERHRLIIAEHHDPLAQAIEARRAETGTGSVGDESAVPKGCAHD